MGVVVVEALGTVRVRAEVGRETKLGWSLVKNLGVS